MSSIEILFVEPYDTGSHAQWMRGYQRYSQHEINILSLEGQFWQWRLLGGAVPLAEAYLQRDKPPDLIVASDMLDLTSFLALTRHYTGHIPVAVYFHESQLTYPSGPRQKLDNHYAYINYLSALTADAIFFNSRFHMTAFFEELPRLLKHFPDYQGLHTVDVLQKKASVLPIGLDLARFDRVRPIKRHNGPPIILWNHRWEYDKNPETFFDTLYRLQDDGFDYQVIIAGPNVRQEPTEFLEAKHRLADRIIHFGYVDVPATYSRYLWQSDYIVSTAYQDFFGVSVVEGIYCESWPLLANRLNYPDLVPEQFHNETLFTKDAGLYHLLHDHLASPRPFPQELREHVAPFDWRSLVAYYDDQFLRIIDRQAAT